MPTKSLEVYELSVDDALRLEVQFFDQAYFEDTREARAQRNALFISGKDLLPSYHYPWLAKLHTVESPMDEDPETLSFKKNRLQDAVFTLVSAKENGKINPALAELFLNYYELRLKRMMLVEAAEAMNFGGSDEHKETFRQTFMELNRELYGEVDTEAWLGIMTTERNRLAGFELQTEQARAIKEELETFYSPLPEVQEKELLDEELLKTYQEFIRTKYANILAAIPDTGDDVYYNAAQTAEIIRAAMAAAGGYEQWTVEIVYDKLVPSTNSFTRKVRLPANFNRNASQIARLTLHEVEVHARRGQNGSRYPHLKILQQGTAGYSEAEEGLGVFLEMVLAGTIDNPSVNRARDRYITAGLAYGVDGRNPRDGRATFEILWRILAIRTAHTGAITNEDVVAAKKEAMIHIENAFRATDFASAGTIYAKLKVYYEGLLKNVEYAREIAKDPATFEQKYDEMFIGKYNHTDPEERALVLASI